MEIVDALLVIRGYVEIKMETIQENLKRYKDQVTEYERKHNPIGIMIRNQDVEGCKQSLDNLSDVIKKIDSVINFEINNKCVVEELPF